MKSFSAVGIVLKRTNTGELDRVVTIFTKEYGKLVAVAKGSRKLTSSKLSALEPGCLIKAHFVKGGNLPILTQAQIVEDFSLIKSDLPQIRNMFQILEMLDSLLPEGDSQPQVFDMSMQLLSSLSEVGVNKTAVVRQTFANILSVLGFAEEKVDLTSSLHDYIESLTTRKLKAFAYLT
jgi:DNA repair protein RecO (recombination protein O)